MQSEQLQFLAMSQHIHCPFYVNTQFRVYFHLKIHSICVHVSTKLYESKKKTVKNARNTIFQSQALPAALWNRLN